MSLGKTTTLEIRTPEGVSFGLPLASPVIRCLAWGIDLIIVYTIMLVINFIFSMLIQIFGTIPIIGDVIIDLGSAMSILLFSFIVMVYPMFMEWFWRGQTIGKRLFGLQVVDERGLTLGLRQIILRNLFRAVDILPSLFYLIGGASCLISARCQRLGDIAAGTLVIRRLRLAQPELDQIMSDDVNSFRSWPHLEARLRQRTSPEEAQVALDSLIRRNELDSGNRLDVFEALAGHFREITEFPEEATLGLSDEQYVRNVVETLFRKTVMV